jgi:hypothetical protein
MLRRFLLITALAGALAAVPALASPESAPKPLGAFGAWRAYVWNDNGEDICYMTLRARGAAMRGKIRRGPVTLMITERPAENSRDVVSYEAGYVFKPNSDLKISLGKSNFSLFTDKDTAWASSSMADHAFTQAMLKNPGLTALGTPAARGAGVVTDTIALQGAPEAYRAIAKACGMEIETPAKPAKSKKKSTK